MRMIIMFAATMLLAAGPAAAQSDKAQNEKCAALKGEEKAVCMKALAADAKTARGDAIKEKGKDKSKAAKEKAKEKAKDKAKGKAGE